MSESAEAAVVVEQAAPAVALVRFNRPELLNAMNTQLAQELIATMERLAGDRSVRVVIVTGTGVRAFCPGRRPEGAAGHDRRCLGAPAQDLRGRLQVPSHLPEAGLRRHQRRRLRARQIAAEGARFGQPEVRVGIMPGGGTRLLGLARQLLMTGKLIDAQTALRVGLVNSRHAPDQLCQVAIALATRIAASSPSAVAHVRKSVNAGIGAGLAEAIEIEHYGHADRDHDRLVARLLRSRTSTATTSRFSRT